MTAEAAAAAPLVSDFTEGSKSDLSQDVTSKGGAGKPAVEKPSSMEVPTQTDSSAAADAASAAVLLSSPAFNAVSALRMIASRQDSNAPWPSLFQELDATQGHKAALTYTADASVVHAWLVAHVLAPGIPLLGLDTEWSSTQPTVAVLQLATANAALVYHASVGTRRSPELYSNVLDSWLASAVFTGFAAWEQARKAGTELPRLQVPVELSDALSAQMGASESPWNINAPSEYAPAWPPADNQEHNVPVVQPLGASSYLPSGLIAMASAFSSDGGAADLGASSCEELQLQARPRVAGVAVEQDTSNLEKNWGVSRMACVDTAALAGDMGLPAGLARQSRQLHGTHTWKSRKLHSVGNWNLGPLTTRPLEYAARDALYSRLNADYVMAYRAALKSDSAPDMPAQEEHLPRHALHGIGQPWQNQSTKAALKSSFAYLGDSALVSSSDRSL